MSEADRLSEGERREEEQEDLFHERAHGTSGGGKFTRESGVALRFPHHSKPLSLSSQSKTELDPPFRERLHRLFQVVAGVRGRDFVGGGSFYRRREVGRVGKTTL